MVRSAVSPGDPERGGDHGFDRDVGMRFPPQPRERFQRLAQAELGKADGPEPLQHPAGELLERVDLFQQGAAVLSDRVGIRRAPVRELRQRARMRAQREQIRPEFVVQFARDLLALDVLERHRALGQTPLFLDRLAERRREMIELAADRGQLGRTAGRGARVVMPALDRGHRLRQRLQRRERAADHRHHHQEQRERDHRADLELGHDGVPDLGDLVIGMRGDHQRARLAMDRDRHAHGGLLGMNQADEPGRRSARVVVGRPAAASAGYRRRPEARC